MTLHLYRSLAFLLFLTCSTSLSAESVDTLRIMSFNLWHGGDAGKQPLEQTAAVIKAAKADIVGLQETHGHAPEKGKPRPDHAAKLAAILGWNYLDQGGRTGIITRLKITASTPGKWGATIELPSGREVHHFNAHFPDAPYQPYQLLSIPYGNGPFFKTAEEAIAAAKQARGKQVAAMLAEMKPFLGKEAAIFLTGDFNEPSHHDWTENAAKAGLCPIAVEWPTTKAVVDAGLIDAYRAVHNDEVKHRGLTWTPVTKITDPKDRHDRIDFVFASSNVKVISAQVVGESKDHADIIVTPYPSDHRAVVVQVAVSGAR